MSALFYSLISFVVAIFFIMIGIICMMLPWSEAVRTDLVQFILEDSLVISLFGIGSLIIGLAIVVNIILGSRRHYYHVKSGSKSVTVDETLIQQYLNTYWGELFPNCSVPNKFSLKSNKIYVAADLPYLPVKEQKALIERVKTDLQDIFKRILGYQNEFHLSISFQSESKAR